MKTMLQKKDSENLQLQELPVNLPEDKSKCAVSTHLRGAPLLE